MTCTTIWTRKSKTKMMTTIITHTCTSATSGHVNDLSDFSSHHRKDDYEFLTGTGTNVYANV